MGDDAAATSKLNGMTSEFKDKSDQMLKDIMTNFNAAVEATLKNFGLLQTSYLKGYEDITNQTKKANEDMLKNMGDNLANLKRTMQTNYDTMTTTVTADYEKVITNVKKDAEEMIKKYPNAGIPPTLMGDAISSLNNHYKTVMDATAKKYKGILEQLDKKYKLLAEQVSIPVLNLPKLIEPVLKGGVGAKDEASSSSKSNTKK